MDARKITDATSVAPQLGVADFAEIAARGFRTVINNRPDGEEGYQPAASELEAAARAQGLAFVNMPVVSGQITARNIADFAAALDTVEGPVLAFCRTGTRCANLWALAQAGRADADEILRRAADAGYNLDAPQALSRSGARG